MSLPFPPQLAAHFASRAFGGGNLSLRFDRGMDRYGEGDSWSIPPRGREEFFADFAKDFPQPPDFPAFLDRRDRALKSVGAIPVDLATRTRLVVGLGLPHPTETGFLLDRTTGSPYLPGSSLKGLLRAAAQGDGWEREAIERVFGPEIRPGATPRKGGGRFFDAFPRRWPKLEVDILTPHHATWNGGEPDAVPADWEDPIPVPFLTVAAENPFRFYLAAAPPAGPEDLDRLKALLPEALDQEGVGAKKSSGYGTFRRETWVGVRLTARQGAAVISHNRREATCRLDDLPPEAAAELARRKPLTVEVEVEPTGPWTYRITRVVWWRT